MLWLLFLFPPKPYPQLEIINMVMQRLICTRIEMTDTCPQVILNNIKIILRDSVYFYQINLFLKVKCQALYQAIQRCVETENHLNRQTAPYSKYKMSLPSFHTQIHTNSLWPYFWGSRLQLDSNLGSSSWRYLLHSCSWLFIISAY